MGTQVKGIVFLLFLTFSTLVLSGFHQDLQEDAVLQVPDLIKKYGYPSETHYVTTADGYIVTLHRIPRGKKNTIKAKKGKVILLNHGLLCSSASWIVTGPENGLGYLLADAGYDVWMSNSRGNFYSQNHTYLSTKSKEFWNFDWHQIAIYDQPATIDYILDVTKEKDLALVGHSQGNTVFYVLADYKPDYNKKVKVLVNLAAIAYMNHMTSPLYHLIATWEQPFGQLTKLIGVNQLLPSNKFMTLVVNDFCKERDLTRPICTNLYFQFSGYNSDNLNKTTLPIILAHFPAGSSVKQLLHFCQEINSGHFRQYDYGYFQNQRVYGTSHPPEYNLSRTTVPAIIFWSKNDWLSAEVDVKRLIERLPNVQTTFLIQDPKFGHLDYLFGVNARDMVYDPLIKLLEKY